MEPVPKFFRSFGAGAENVSSAPDIRYLGKRSQNWNNYAGAEIFEQRSRIRKVTEPEARSQKGSRLRNLVLQRFFSVAL